MGNALNGCLPPPPGFEERVFTVVPGMLLGEPSPLAGFHSRTGLFTSGLGSLGPNVADKFSEGPLVLVRGPEDENGESTLSLRDDVFITVAILDGSLLCIRMLAEDSGGSIACSGGVPYDVEASQPAGDVGLAFEVRTGLGPEAGPGSANLLVMQQTQPIAAADFDSCETADYTDPPQLWAYTTELATAIKATTGSDRTLAVQGASRSPATPSIYRMETACWPRPRQPSIQPCKGWRTSSDSPIVRQNSNYSGARARGAGAGSPNPAP